MILIQLIPSVNVTSICRWLCAFLVVLMSTDVSATEPWHKAQSGELYLRAGGQSWQQGVHLHSHADIRISGMVVEVEYRQTFKNASDQWQEAVYVFPLGEQAAVHALRMTVGEREIVGEIKEKAQAQQIYQQAKREGKKAALLDQQRPNLFTQRIANIAPGETISVTLGYTEAARFDAGQFFWRLPTTLTPRYVPKAARLGDDAGATTAAGLVPVHSGNPTVDFDPASDSSFSTPLIPPATKPAQSNEITIDVGLAAGLPLANVAALYHDLDVTRTGNNNYKLALREGPAAMDRDFLLQWRPVSSRVPTAAMFRQKVDGEDYMMLMVLPPDADTTGTLPRDVVFILDTSGSMAGSSMEQAKAALARAVGQLSEADRFNVIEFNSDHSVLFKRLRGADEATRAEAVRWVQQLEAGGGTEMLPALEAAFAATQNESTTLKQIVFITDGAVANETALFHRIQQQLGDSRLFTVGIGSAPNSYFMRKAAQFGRGTFTYIDAGSEVADVMDQLFYKLSSAAASDVQLTWPVAAEQFPARVPDLYRGEPLVVYAKAPAVTGELVISGDLTAGSANSPVQTWQQNLPLSALAPAKDNAGIARLWARQKVEALEDQRVAGADAVATGEKILALALTHGLVTAYTSFVAVEHVVSRPPSAAAGSSSVGNLLPKGQLLQPSMRAIAFPTTATSRSLSVYLGVVASLTALLLLLYHARVLERRHERA